LCQECIGFNVELGSGAENSSVLIVLKGLSANQQLSISQEFGEVILNKLGKKSQKGLKNHIWGDGTVQAGIRTSCCH